LRAISSASFPGSKAGGGAGVLPQSCKQADRG
jgi:hypothetical protein